jgi:nitrate/nitrite-specific signal transduction histidine kinase
MRERAVRIGAALEITNGNKQGAVVRLTLARQGD